MTVRTVFLFERPITSTSSLNIRTTEQVCSFPGPEMISVKAFHTEFTEREREKGVIVYRLCMIILSIARPSAVISAIFLWKYLFGIGPFSPEILVGLVRNVPDVFGDDFHLRQT